MSAQSNKTSREHIYTLQIQPDWHIITLNHSKSINTAQPQPELSLEGLGDTLYHLQLPKATENQKFWLNITRISPENEQHTIFQTVNLIPADCNKSNPHLNLPKLFSEAVDIDNVIQHYSKNAPKRFLSLSMTLKKELSTRVIINTKVISPWYQNPNLHKEILDSKRAKKSQKDHNDETNLRLRPGDLDSDDDNNNTDLNNLDRVDPAAIHRDEYKNIQKLINKEQDKITTALNQQGSYELIQSKRSTTIPIVNCVDINPVNTNLIISGAERGDLRVWDSNTGEVMFVLHQNSSNAQNSPNLEPYHLGDITSVQWLHNGIMALSGSMDCTIKLWLAAQYGKCMKTFVGHNRAVVQVTQHHTYKNKIISIGKDGRLIVFNISHTGSSGSNGGVMVVPPENEFQIISDSLVNDFGETLHSFAIHPTNHDIIYVISSIGIHCVDLRLTRDEYYGKQKLQTDSKLEPPAPILTKQALLKCCFKPNSSPNHDDNVLYIGTNEGSVLKYSLPNTLLAQKIIDPEGDPILPVQKTNHKSYEEFSLFDEAITGMKWYNNELYVSTFQGDCCSLNENFTLQPVLLSGTDQPLRGVDVKFENEDEKDQNGANGGQNGCVKVVACGDDGVFVWKL